MRCSGRALTVRLTRIALRTASLLQRLIIPGLKLREKIVLIDREMLRKGNGYDLLCRINLTVRSGGAIPAELPDR